MHTQVFLTALLASAPLIAAHGKVAVAVGDAGGNGTALGIQGGIVPGGGNNKATEPDTTLFKGNAKDSCGRTTGGGTNQIEAGTKQAMALSGNTLPQVTPGGSLSGTFHVVTSDGAGPLKAEINTDGTGNGWQPLTVQQNVPGRGGNIRKQNKRFVLRAIENALDSVGLLSKRATNINEDYPYKVAIPADAKCTGNVAGQQNVCMVRLVNPNNNGPFGGCIPVQMVQPGAAKTAKVARRAEALSA